MGFTTPCFVCVKDVEKRKELTEWLKDIGYKTANISLREGVVWVVCNANGCAYSAATVGGEYNCGANIELFKALSALRNDSDYMQWFVCEQIIKIYSGNRLLMIGDMFSLAETKFDGTVKAHKATLNELISQFSENRFCNACNTEVEKETDADYPFYCPECDENKYTFETYEAKGKIDEYNEYLFAGGTFITNPSVRDLTS